jgi:hypothetical protein
MICVLAEITLGRDHREEVRQFTRLIAFGNQQKLEQAFARAAVARRDHPHSDLSNRAGQAFQTADLRNFVRAPWVIAGML